MYWQQIGSAKKSLKKLPISVKAVLVSKDGRVLLMRKSSGLVDLPGGKVEPGEDVYEALQREIEEEVRFSVRKFDFVSSWVRHHPILGDRLMLVFETQLKRKAKSLDVKLSDEHVWGQFLDAEGVDEIGDLQPGYANALQICFSRYAIVGK